jgi:hypothetical protein
MTCCKGTVPTYLKSLKLVLTAEQKQELSNMLQILVAHSMDRKEAVYSSDILLH